MDPNTEINQMGNPPPSPTPIRSGNMLTPMQQMQQMQYANSLMSGQGGPPANSIGGGLGEMARSLLGGYMMNQASPMGGGTNAPMQLPSANGGSSPSSIFSGMFPGMM